MNNRMAEDERAYIANKVSYTTLIINIILSFFKFMAGIFGKSNAMIADSVHTLSDVITTIAVIIGIHFSARPADEGHPYGHEKIESVVAKMLAIALMLTALLIGYNGIKTIISGNYSKPTSFALIAAIISIVSKEWMYQYTMVAARKINSGALKADAWHHRSDALSSIGTLVGIGGAMIGFEILDPIASLVVTVMIIKVALDIFITGFKQLIDCSAPPEVIKKITEIIEGIDGVLRIDELKTRMHGTLVYVDAEISVSSNISVCEGHSIAETVHEEIEKQIDGVKHCMVHINPYEDEKQ